MHNGIKFTYDPLILVIREAISTGIISPVEATHFIRTVVGAISRTNATVISHLVNAFAAVVGSCYRANVFARRIVTVLAKHRLKNNSFKIIRILFIGNKIAIDAQPMHIVVT